MIRILHLVYDTLLDKIQGGDVHRSRRMLARLKKTRSDLESLLAVPATPEMAEAISRHVEASTQMIDSLEARIELEVSALAALRQARRAGNPSKDEILRCMLDAERERYGTLPRSAYAKHLDPEPRVENVQGGGAAAGPDGPKADGKFRVN